MIYPPLFRLLPVLLLLMPLLCGAQSKYIGADMEYLYRTSRKYPIEKFEREHVPLDGAKVPCIPFRKDELYGFVDKKTKEWVIKPRFKQVFAVYEEGAIVNYEGRYGLVNYKDSFLIPPVFSNVLREGGLFHGVLTAVDTSIKPEHNSLYTLHVYYNTKGKYVLSARAHDEQSFGLNDSVAWFRYADTFKVYGRSGVLLKRIPFDKRKVFTGVFGGCYVYRETTSDFAGFKWYDGKGKLKHKIWANASEYKTAYRLSANVYGLVGEEGIYFIDTNKTYYPWAVDNGMVFPGYADMYDGLLHDWLHGDGLVPVTDMKTNKHGYLNGKGELVLPCVYDWIGTFENGIAAWLDTATHKIGFMDRRGRAVIRPVLGAENLEQVRLTGMSMRFSEGYCPISIGKRHEDGGRGTTDYYGYADTAGKVVLVMPDSIVFAGEFSGGLAPVIAKSGGLGFIDREGNLKIPLRYEAAMEGAYPFPRVVFPEFINGYAYIKSYKGYIDSTGYEYFSGKRMQDHYDFSH